MMDRVATFSFFHIRQNTYKKQNPKETILLVSVRIIMLATQSKENCSIKVT